MKTIWPHPINEENTRIGICPFMGFQVANLKEFAELLKTRYYNLETGYPGLFFNTRDKNTTIVFTGHEFEHPKGKMFSIFHKGDRKPHDWFSLRDPIAQEYFELFDDTENIERRVKAWSAIFATGASVEFTIR